MVFFTLVKRVRVFFLLDTIAKEDMGKQSMETVADKL